MELFFRLLICLTLAGVGLYKYIDQHNELTELRLSIPALAKEVKELKEINLSLKYEIECFESPLHLMEIAMKPEFGYLKHPKLNEEIFLLESTTDTIKLYDSTK